MRYAIWALLVFSELLQENSALICLLCLENSAGIKDVCAPMRCKPGENYCQAKMSPVMGPEVMRSCSPEGDEEIGWDGNCLRESTSLKGAVGCRCYSDFCNDDCGCGAPAVSTPVTDNPKYPELTADSYYKYKSQQGNHDDRRHDNNENEDRPALRCLFCRENSAGLRDRCVPKQCEPGENYCVALMLEPPAILRQCTSAVGEWDGNNCMRGNPMFEEGAIGCRCKSDFCNGDCKCGVPAMSTTVEDNPLQREMTADSYYKHKPPQGNPDDRRQDTNEDEDRRRGRARATTSWSQTTSVFLLAFTGALQWSLAM